MRHFTYKKTGARLAGAQLIFLGSFGDSARIRRRCLALSPLVSVAFSVRLSRFLVTTIVKVVSIQVFS